MGSGFLIYYSWLKSKKGEKKKEKFIFFYNIFKTLFRLNERRHSWNLEKRFKKRKLNKKSRYKKQIYEEKKIKRQQKFKARGVIKAFWLYKVIKRQRKHFNFFTYKLLLQKIVPLLKKNIAGNYYSITLVNKLLLVS